MIKNFLHFLFSAVHYLLVSYMGAKAATNISEIIMLVVALTCSNENAHVVCMEPSYQCSSKIAHAVVCELVVPQHQSNQAFPLLL